MTATGVSPRVNLQTRRLIYWKPQSVNLRKKPALHPKENLFPSNRLSKKGAKQFTHGLLKEIYPIILFINAIHSKRNGPLIRAKRCSFWKLIKSSFLSPKKRKKRSKTDRL